VEEYPQGEVVFEKDSRYFKFLEKDHPGTSCHPSAGGEL